MKAIMYHYVSPKIDEFPNLNRLDLDSFIKQLDYFNDKYGFISQNDFLVCNNELQSSDISS